MGGRAAALGRNWALSVPLETSRAEAQLVRRNAWNLVAEGVGPDI